MYRDIAPFDPETILQDEWLNSRGAIARFDRHAIEIRVLDTQESPPADLAIATIIVSVLKSLVAGLWMDPQRLSAISTAELAEMLLDFINNADEGIIHKRNFLEMFAFPDKKCSGREFWQYLRESVALDDDPVLDAALNTILDHGPLARRILLATGREVKQPRLEEVYRRLSECLAEGEIFRGID